MEEVEQQTEIQQLPAARRRPNITTEPRREMSSDHISLEVKGDIEDPEAAQEDSKSKKTKNNRWTDQDFSDAFDDLYKLNAFIVFAIFIGISLTALGQRSLQNRPECDADPEVTMEVIEFGAISFGIMTGLSAMLIVGVKNWVRSLKAPSCKQMRRRVQKWGLVAASCASYISVILIALSISSVLQVRLGLISCGSKPTITAIWMLDLAIGVGFAICSIRIAKISWSA
ncbi:hypothetical protein BVC80_1653g46 [Macleaya cordata]|uniref:Uncharacterized protein n=1 Tax=Macleaya cordata TaxID=56857 RepID=A0A200PSU2_MACCD|nr:hypothetical protein BVC80_1653g46 [Macleaya cordata]